MHPATPGGAADIGVAIVPSVPHADAILYSLCTAAAVLLVLTIRYLFAEKLVRVAVFGVLFALFAGSIVTYFVRNGDELRTLHDYPATFAALEARYGVTLDPARTAEVTFGRSGKFQTVSQERVGSVTRTDGTVIEDVYVQFSTGDHQRAALVLPDDGTNTLLVTRNTWWPELPVVG